MSIRSNMAGGVLRITWFCLTAELRGVNRRVTQSLTAEFNRRVTQSLIAEYPKESFSAQLCVVLCVTLRLNKTAS
jgi:hypothetical protein